MWIHQTLDWDAQHADTGRDLAVSDQKLTAKSLWRVLRPLDSRPAFYLSFVVPETSGTVKRKRDTVSISTLIVFFFYGKQINIEIVLFSFSKWFYG